MKPIVELKKYVPDTNELEVYIKIFSDGRAEGFDGVVINRIPDAMNMLCQAIGEAVSDLGDDIKKSYSEVMKKTNDRP